MARLNAPGVPGRWRRPDGSDEVTARRCGRGRGRARPPKVAARRSPREPARATSACLVGKHPSGARQLADDLVVVSELRRIKGPASSRADLRGRGNRSCPSLSIRLGCFATPARAGGSHRQPIWHQRAGGVRFALSETGPRSSAAMAARQPSGILCRHASHSHVHGQDAFLCQHATMAFHRSLRIRSACRPSRSSLDFL